MLQHINRSAIKKDIFFFGVPALAVLVMGIGVNAQDEYDGLTTTIIRIIQNPETAADLSVNKIVGLLLFLIGLTIAFTAVGTLKRFYSSTLVTKPGHKLITHGVYRFVRHPIYTAVLLILVVAVPTYSSSLKGCVAMSPLILLFLIRIRLEERLLTEEFGDAYRDYAKSTRKLVPFVH